MYNIVYQKSISKFSIECVQPMRMANEIIMNKVNLVVIEIQFDVFTLYVDFGIRAFTIGRCCAFVVIGLSLSLWTQHFDGADDV